MGENDERREYLKRLMSFTCPVPQYKQTRVKLAEWCARNNGSGKKK